MDLITAERLLEALDDQGYCEFQAMDRNAAASLNLAYERIWASDQAYFQTDTLVPDARRIEQSAAAIQASFRVPPAFAEAGFEPFSWGFVAKRPGPQSAVDVHQDWSVVDELAGHRSVGLWIALRDLEPNAGRLEVAAGTHRRAPGPRGDGLGNDWLAELTDGDFVQIATTAGAAVIFDEAIAHRSAANLSGRARAAARVRFKPIGVPLTQFWRIDESTVGVRQLDPRAYQDPARYMQRRPPDSAAERLVRVDAGVARI